MKAELVRIVPPSSGVSGLTQTQGTQVYVGDQPLTGVTKIVLRAEVGGLWTAEIHCYAKMDSMTALATIHEEPKKWWERLLDWICGEPHEPQP